MHPELKIADLCETRQEVLLNSKKMTQTHMVKGELHIFSFTVGLSVTANYR